MNPRKETREQLVIKIREANRRIAELEKAASEHEASVEKLEAGISKLKKILEVFPLGITLTDESGRIVERNLAAKKLLEIPSKDHGSKAGIGREWRIIRPDGTLMPEEEFPAVRALKEGRLIENVEMGVVKESDVVHWINVTAAPIPIEGYGVAVVYGDFTRGRKAEEDLQRSKELYRQLFEDDLTGNFMAAPDGRILMCNPSFARIFGFSNREEALKGNMADLHLTPDSYADFINLLRDRKVLVSYEGGRRRCDGSIIHVVENAVGTFDEHDELIEYKAYIFDDTERKRVEDELRESEERFRIMADSSPLMIWVVDETGDIQFVNSTYRDFFKISKEQIKGLDYRLLIHPDDRDAFLGAFLQSVQEKKSFHAIGRARRGDGSWRWIESHGSTRYSPDGRFLGLVCGSSDITERKEAEESLKRYRDHLEELVKERTDALRERNRKLAHEIAERRKAEAQLVQAQKIEALGRFAGGIAHDLNNMLYPIIIEAESLLEEMPPGTPWHQTVNQILSAATRQRDLVKQILSFSRRGDRRFTPIQLGPLISETVAFIRSSLPSTIEITQRIDAAHDRILGDPTQIQQVVVNLCQNAVDALESQKGVVEISLENTRLERTESHPEIKEGEYLKLSVRDYGRGMSPEIVSRIFEPFYTTKEVGKGAGMGLPVIHGIIRSHGGMITVESEPGKGSIFTAYFPVTGRQPKVRKLPVKGAPQVHGRILLVDDELIVLSSVSKALKHLGYEVTAVEDSGEAFAVFSRSPGEFDLVITDLTMPGMSGIELAEKIKELSPDVPVILCTGFNDIIDEQEAREKGITGLIFKPAGTRDLGAAVGQALESR